MKFDFAKEFADVLEQKALAGIESLKELSVSDEAYRRTVDNIMASKALAGRLTMPAPTAPAPTADEPTNLNQNL